MSMINFDADPKPSMKWGFFGREKRGKTHGMCSAAITACRELELPGNIACIATENWVPDWLERLRKHTGKKVAICQTPDPGVALKFAMECEKSPDVSLLLIDCGSDLVLHNRERFMADKGRAPKGAEYSVVDRPFAAFVRWCSATSLHWICTLREEDDKQEVDDQEIVIGKSGKGKLAEVARPLIHCTLARGKAGSPTFKAFVKDTAAASASYDNPTSEQWKLHLQRYK